MIVRLAEDFATAIWKTMNRMRRMIAIMSALQRMNLKASIAISPHFLISIPTLSKMEGIYENYNAR